jgi:hypothetical protein
MIKLYLENKLNRYFSSVKWGVWLIVLPAIFIITINFFSSFNEIVIKKERSRMIDYEKRFAALKKDLPGHTFVNFVSDQDSTRDYFAARYALIPARLVRGLEPQHDLLVVQVSDLSERPNFAGYTLKKDYGNGVMLFSRSVDQCPN